jgi:hypothetical protein
MLTSEEGSVDSWRASDSVETTRSRPWRASFLFSDSYARRGYDDLTETVRRGRTLLDGAGVVDAEDEVWIDFARRTGSTSFGTGAW